MAKNSEKAIDIRKKRDDTAAIVAQIHHVTDGYVRKVINGERNNDSILSSYIKIKQEKNKLIEAVKELVPFN